MSKTGPEEGAYVKEGNRNTKQSFQEAEKTQISPPLQQHDTTTSEKEHGPITVESPEVSSLQQSSPSPRQVIAVSASKGPATFFNLARKFLATDETCDLSALEGAIVSAVDAANLLERSQLARITRIETSYVAVEPKRKKQTPTASAATSPTATAEKKQDIAGEASAEDVASMSSIYSSTASAMPPSASIQHETKAGVPSQTHHKQGIPLKKPVGKKKGKKEVRRARITITVQRTAEYAEWLKENPTEEHDAGEEDGAVTATLTAAGEPQRRE